MRHIWQLQNKVLTAGQHCAARLTLTWTVIVNFFSCLLEDPTLDSTDKMVSRVTRSACGFQWIHSMTLSERPVWAWDRAHRSINPPLPLSPAVPRQLLSPSLLQTWEAAKGSWASGPPLLKPLILQERHNDEEGLSEVVAGSSLQGISWREGGMERMTGQRRCALEQKENKMAGTDG